MDFDNYLMFNSCYYIRLRKMDEETIEKFKFISVEMLEANKKEDKFIAIENEDYFGNGYEFMYLFFEEGKTLNYISELALINAIEFYENVTDDLINGKLDQNEDFKKIYFGFPEQQKDKKSKSEFAYLFDFFLLKNRTIDHVIDRISTLGIDNIWDIDREILKKNLS